MSVTINTFKSFQKVDATPAIPTGLTLTLIAGGVNVAWTDNSGGVAQTEIWGKSDGAASALLYTINAGTVTKDDAAVTPVDLRYYKVRAKNGTDYSEYTSEVSIAMLGSELINQSTWYTSGYWNTFPATWSQSGTTLVCNGTGGYVKKSSLFTIGYKYRLIITVSRTSGWWCVQDTGAYLINLTTSSGTFTVYKTAAGTPLWIGYGDVFGGTVSALSLKRILSP